MAVAGAPLTIQPGSSNLTICVLVGRPRLPRLLSSGQSRFFCPLFNRRRACCLGACLRRSLRRLRHPCCHGQLMIDRPAGEPLTAMGASWFWSCWRADPFVAAQRPEDLWAAAHGDHAPSASKHAGVHSSIPAWPASLDPAARGSPARFWLILIARYFCACHAGTRSQVASTKYLLDIGFSTGRCGLGLAPCARHLARHSGQILLWHRYPTARREGLGALSCLGLCDLFLRALCG